MPRKPKFQVGDVVIFYNPLSFNANCPIANNPTLIDRGVVISIDDGDLVIDPFFEGERTGIPKGFDALRYVKRCKGMRNTKLCNLTCKYFYPCWTSRRLDQS